MSTIRLAIGLAVTIATLTLGVLVLLGYMLTPDVSSQFRWIMGGVLLAFGIYRGIMLNAERKRKSAASEKHST